MSGSGDYISREAVNQIIAAQCGECADACLEFDGIQPDCNQCLLHGAKKAIESIPAADVRPRWIPVTERLPEARERVLCYCRAYTYEVMKMRTNGDWVYDTHHVYMHSFVTHWMPLPKGPEEET